MKNIYLSLFLFFLSCINPKESNQKKNISEVDKVSLVQDFQIFHPKKNSFVDSLIQSVSELSDLKVSIEDLTKLNPLGIESFLDETLIKCNNLLNLENNSFISKPEIRGRLKVLKTNILKCKFNNNQNDIKKLNESLESLFLSYNILFERLEDFR